MEAITTTLPGPAGQAADDEAGRRSRALLDVIDSIAQHRELSTLFPRSPTS